MKLKHLLYVPIAALAISCGDSGEKAEGANAETDNAKKPEAGVYLDRSENPLMERYPKVPETLTEYASAKEAGKKAYKELQDRYAANFATLKQKVEASGAKFVLLIVTPTATQGMQADEMAGINFIRSVAAKNGAATIDLTAALNTQSPKKVTQVPKDGHWSKDGSVFLTNEVAKVLPQYFSVKNATTFANKPETFGDLDINSDQILDGGKGLPYHVTTNAKGMRMKGDITFPKTKQRILFMGDSEIYSPFLDDEYIMTYLLQQKFTDREILNASAIGYTLDDYISLYEEKAKFSEPDVVIVATNPADITDFYFSQRNRNARSFKAYEPTTNEVNLYKALYGSK